MRVDWNVSEPMWRDFARVCSHATIFHTPAWHDVHAHLGYRRFNARFRFKTGEEALLPLALRWTFRGMSWEAISGLEGGYGGLIAPVPLSPAQVEQAYGVVKTRFPTTTITSNPFEVFENGALQLETASDFTRVVPLLPRREQRRRLTEAQRKATIAAENEDLDLVVRVGLKEQDLSRFMPVYWERACDPSAARIMRPPAYFRALIRTLGPDLTLFTAYQEGILAGFMMIACYGRVAHNLQMAIAENYAHWNVMPRLMSEAMAWAYEHGMERLDLMPSGQSGVDAWLWRTFGSEPIPFVVSTQALGLGATLGRWLGNKNYGEGEIA